MASASGSGRPADDTDPLLTSDASEHSIRPSLRTRSSSWLQGSLYVYRTTTAMALRLNVRILWVFLPLSLAAEVFHMNPIAIAIFNFLAIIPLSEKVSDLSDKLSDAFGDLLGALINATFGNAVELIVGLLAVIRGDAPFAQSVMLGSILSDILFILGCCFFSAAWRQPILSLNPAVADALSSLMIITAVALLLPTALYSTFEASEPTDVVKQILAFSRGTAAVLLLLYIAYLYFELKSHKYLFDGSRVQDWEDSHNHIIRQGSWMGSRQNSQQTIRDDAEQTTQEETTIPSNLFLTFLALVGFAACIMLCARFLLMNIDKTSEVTHISRTFIATILIPIASNAPEGATVISSSRNGRIDFALGVIVSSILQIALCVIPILVIVGWVVQQPMTLNFEAFQAIILFLAILLVNHLLQNGRYTYMHGLVLTGLYAMIATAFFLRDDI